MINVLVRAALIAAVLAFSSSGALVLQAKAVAAQACKPVPGKDLEQFYPPMAGWTRGEPSSETDVAESVSRTTVDFDRKLETISVELMDSCRNPDVLQLIRNLLKEMPPATPGTTQRYTRVNGLPAYEEFTAMSGHGEIHMLVADRFMIKVTAETSTLPTLQNSANLIPVHKLEAIK